MVEYTYFALGACVSQCLILGATGIKLRSTPSLAWQVVVLSLALASYFLMPIFHKADLLTLVYVSLAFAGATPSLFLLICQEIFQDEPTHPHLTRAAAAALFLANIALIILIESGILERSGGWVIPHRIALVSLPLWGIGIVLSGFKNELVEIRLRFRYTFTVFMVLVATIIGVNAASNDFTFETWNLDSPELLLSTSISAIVLLGINCFIMISDLTSLYVALGSTVENETSQVQEGQVESLPHDPIGEKLEKAMREDKAYLEEGLSVSQLSKIIGEPSYKVRQYINQTLNYRNFNSYLNKYRIEDAKILLKTPEYMDEKIFAIALKVGFSSLSPFNRSFKEETGMTPSEFRKAG